jgi:hypothetical protein
LHAPRALGPRFREDERRRGHPASASKLAKAIDAVIARSTGAASEAAAKEAKEAGVYVRVTP